MSASQLRPLRFVEPGQRPGLLAILPHFGTVARTEAAIASLRAAGYAGLTVLVIDNSDGVASESLEGHELGEGVHVARPGANEGYCAAINRGLARAQEDAIPYVALVNADVEIAGGCLQSLVDALESDETRVGAGPLITTGGGTRVWCAGADMRFGPNVSVLRGHGRATDRAPRLPERVDYLPGAMVIYRRAALDAVGGLDESYFMYGEDVDLGYRLRVRGGQLLYVPWARAEHEASSSSGGGVTPLRKFLNAVNTPRFLRRMRSPRLWLAFWIFDILGLLPSMLLHVHRPGRLRAQFAKARGVWLGLRGYRASARDVDHYLGRSS